MSASMTAAARSPREHGQQQARATLAAAASPKNSVRYHQGSFLHVGIPRDVFGFEAETSPK